MVRRETLADQVAQHIRDVIDARGLLPGDPIPTEIEITQELGVSRGIVREAFRALSASGMINVSSGRRSTVGALQSSVLQNFFSHALITSQADIDNLMTLRQAIEFSAVRLAAVNRTYSHLDQLKTTLDKMAVSLDRHNVYIQHDFQFHLLLCEASGNVLFRLLIESLSDAVHATMRAGIRNRKSENDKHLVQKKHEDVFLAVERGDEDAAEAAMRTHFDAAITAIRENITTDKDLHKIRG